VPPTVPEPSALEPTVPEDVPHVYVMLLGLPVDGDATPCLLEVKGSAGDRSFSSATRLDVHPAEVAETRVALDAALTTIRTRTDARVVQEQKRLDEVLATFTPTSIYILGTLRMPVAGATQSAGFGDRRIYDYANGQSVRSTHNGLDLAVAAGVSVHASGPGRVLLAEELVVTGKTVAIEHLPGLMSFYFHMSVIGVSVGQTVEADEVIGRVGATGLATGPHLHWELRCGGVAVDPRFVMQQPLVDKAAVVRIIVAYRTQSQRR